MTPAFHPGERVRVRSAFPPGHVRTPHYIRGRVGQIERVLGVFEDPEERAFGRSGLPGRPLYRVRFEQRTLWKDYAGSPSDTLDVEVYENWLERE
jgi:nitrile hydratase